MAVTREAVACDGRALSALRSSVVRSRGGEQGEDRSVSVSPRSCSPPYVASRTAPFLGRGRAVRRGVTPMPMVSG